MVISKQDKYQFISFGIVCLAANFVFNIFSTPNILFLISVGVGALLILGAIIVNYRNVFSEAYAKKFYLIATFFLLLVVYYTGGIVSPLFILTHIITIVISFFLSFRSGVIFLICVISAVIFNAISHNLIGLFASDIPLILVYVASIIATIPLAHIASFHYHAKDEGLKQLMKKLYYTENLQFEIFKNIREGIILYSDKNIIERVNPVAEKIIGYKQYDIKGLDFFHVLKIAKAETLLDTLPNTSYQRTDSGFMEGDYTMLRKDAKRVRVNFTHTELTDLSGNKMGNLFVFKDISAFYTSDMHQKEEVPQALEVETTTQVTSLPN